MDDFGLFAPAPQPPATTPTSGGTRAPAWVELYLEPRRFARERLAELAATHTRPQALAAIYLLGIERMLDRLDVDDLLGRRHSVGTGSWAGYLAMVLLGGAFAGPLAFMVGRFFYRLRLKFCGVDAAASPVLSTAFMIGVVCWAAPVLLASVASAIGHASPADAFEGMPLAWFTGSLSLWAAYFDYVTARELFQAPRGKALFWFVILPAAAVVSVGGAVAYRMLH